MEDEVLPPSPTIPFDEEIVSFSSTNVQPPPSSNNMLFAGNVGSAGNIAGFGHHQPPLYAPTLPSFFANTYQISDPMMVFSQQQQEQHYPSTTSAAAATNNMQPQSQQPLVHHRGNDGVATSQEALKEMVKPTDTTKSQRTEVPTSTTSIHNNNHNMNTTTTSMTQSSTTTTLTTTLTNNNIDTTTTTTTTHTPLPPPPPSSSSSQQQQDGGSKKKKKKKEKKNEPRFPFKVLHQKLVLDVDLYQQALVGYTDIRFTPLHNNITQISLHCLQLNVTGVHTIYVNKHKPSSMMNGTTTSGVSTSGGVGSGGTLNSQELFTHQHQHFIDQVSLTQIETHPTKNLDQISREFALQYELENEGTLTITFKVPLLKKTSTTIRIYFDLKNPTSGVYFVNCQKTSIVENGNGDSMRINDSIMMDETNDTREDISEFDENGKRNSKSSQSYPHMYTQSQLLGARCWFPCVDLLSSYHHFDFEITSHADCMIICSGELIRQVENYSGTLKTSYFKTHSILSPASVCLAVGPFNISYSTLTLGSHLQQYQPATTSNVGTSSFTTHPYELTLNAFYLPNYSLESIRHTLGFIKRAFLFLEEYLEFKYRDLFNSTTFNVVFIENGYTEHSSFACMCLVDSNRMILEPNIIDQVQENRTKFTKLLAEQYFGNFIHPKTFSDYWLIDGIAGYLAWQFYESEFGQNTKRFKMMQSGKELLEMEKHTLSLYNESVGAIPQNSQHVHDYISKKAPLVLYMIDRQVSTSHMRELLNKMLFNAHSDQHSKRFSDRLLSTSSFLKTCEKKYAVDLKSFASYWIYGTGVPQFAISFKYDDMRSCVDLKVKQILPYPECPPFKGKVTFRILESEGAPNDFLVDLDREENQFEFHINSKPIKKHHRKITGGTTSEAVRIKIPLKWIRFDPEQDWIKVLSFSQTQEMWIHQLNDVKDVVAQYEAIKALTFFADTEPIIDVLKNIIRDSSYFYQIRVCAAHALSKIPQPIEKKMALDVLIEYFKNQFYAMTSGSSASASASASGIQSGSNTGGGVGGIQSGIQSGDASGIQSGTVGGVGGAAADSTLSTSGDKSIPTPTTTTNTTTPMAITPIPTTNTTNTLTTNTTNTLTNNSITTNMTTLGSSKLLPNNTSSLTTTTSTTTTTHSPSILPSNTPSFLKPNNFRNFAEYFMKKEIPLALTNFRDEKVNNETFPEVILLLLDLIKYNDDSENPFSGSFYIASLIKALSLVNTSNQKFKEKIEKIFYKYLVIDSDLIPSYHHVKTVSSLQALSLLQSSGKSSVKLDLFYRYLNFRQSDYVRFAAWECILNILDSLVVVNPSRINNNNEFIMMMMMDPILKTNHATHSATHSDNATTSTITATSTTPTTSKNIIGSNGSSSNNNNIIGSNGMTMNEEEDYTLFQLAKETMSEYLMRHFQHSQLQLLNHVRHLILNKYLSLMSDEHECPHVKYEISKILSNALYKSSAQMLMQFNEHSQQGRVHLNFVKKVSPLALFLLDVRSPHPNNVKIVESVWEFLQNSNSTTQYDRRLRSAIVEVYRALWDQVTPLCCCENDEVSHSIKNLLTSLNEYFNNTHNTHVTTPSTSITSSSSSSNKSTSSNKSNKSKSSSSSTNSSYSTLFSSKNEQLLASYMIAPSLQGISDLQIVQPQQLKSHQYLKSEYPPVVFDTSHLSKMIITPPIPEESIIRASSRKKQSTTSGVSSSSSNSGGSGSGGGISADLTTTTTLDQSSNSTSNIPSATTITLPVVTLESKKKESKKKESKKKKESSESKKESKKESSSSKKKKSTSSSTSGGDSEKKRKRESEKSTTTTTVSSSSSSETTKKKKKQPEPLDATKIKIKLGDSITTTTPLSSSGVLNSQDKIPKVNKASSSNAIHAPIATASATTTTSSSASMDVSNTTSTTTSAATNPILHFKPQPVEKQLMQTKYKQREEKIKKNSTPSRIMLINMNETDTRIYVELDDHSFTASAIYRSLPMKSFEVSSGGKGIIYFAIPQVEQITDLEEESRSEVKNGELAYWIDGLSIVIGYSKTMYSVQNEIRLYQCCNIFGEMIYPLSTRNITKNVTKQTISLVRLPRVSLDIPELSQSIDIDLYDLEFPNLTKFMAHIMPVRGVFMPPFGKLLYFNLPQLYTPSDEDREHERFYRDYLLPGEVAYWAEGGALLLGTGPSALVPPSSTSGGSGGQSISSGGSSSSSTTHTNQERYYLLTKCFVIGKMISPHYRQLPMVIEKRMSGGGSSSSDGGGGGQCGARSGSIIGSSSSEIPPPDLSLILHKRDIVIQITFKDSSLPTIEMLFGLRNTVTADVIYEHCCALNKVLKFDQFEVSSSSSPVCGMISFSLDSSQEEIANLQHEVNVAVKTISTPGDLAFMWDSYSIIMPFHRNNGHPGGGGEIELPDMANVWARFRSVVVSGSSGGSGVSSSMSYAAAMQYIASKPIQSIAMRRYHVP
ncbi:hypothetical protein FDP41_006255 [Naegleria fowleri]|uniref:Transcription initiation factor TFIID subunit 2 n=1 Tax=Naegleria fowleri TaxID=5763 RepID=A0A6A5BK98_NAEFO|nr:uncharacterized protein FDP41_006255 [Naegleria fowleri]KAF0974781.1 hypothetical protein FDP41_006255 [Naegleria fowleri]